VRRLFRVLLATGVIAALVVWLRQLLEGRVELLGTESEDENSLQGEPSVPTTPANGRAGLTREELYEEAKRLGIEGRSRMSKQELRAAIASRGGGR
jgi:Rho termination factor, N-terminal domain